jgi:acetyltransferase-like isoleucine patch superfamily enzyme
MELFAKLEVLCWLLPPSGLKNAILRRFGHRISTTAHIGPVLAFGVTRFEIGEHVRINPLNVIKDLSLVRLDDEVWINSWNWISAAPEFQLVSPEAGVLHIGRGGKVGSRNYLDCSGTIIIRPYGWVGGNRTFLQTHDVDLKNEQQKAGRIVIGHHSLVHSCSVLLMGAYLPDQSVLATNSTMLASTANEERRGVYAGSPATWQGETGGQWFERTGVVMTDHVIDGPIGLESDTPSVPG